MNLYEDIKRVIKRDITESDAVFEDFLNRLEEGNLTRDENTLTHFGVFFLPFNKKENKVFLVHHKKSGLWIAPGGHIDKDERLLEALNREIQEELGIERFFKEYPNPFLLTRTPIENKGHLCKVHYDFWHLMETNGSNFKVDSAEFYITRWLSFDEARRMVISPSNLKALEVLEKQNL
ncbi:MAG: NUDIX domain-containing protein [Candidatus Gribaldobacteria bacterium]|nr:NUDIX domain-containing protein [Candidatus Gribaldobacteria bacterium]